VSDVHQLTTDQASWSPAFSPDSSEIAFMYRVGANPCTSGIWTMNADGTGMRTLVDGTCRKQFTQPAWLNATSIVLWVWTNGPERPAGLVSISVATGRLRMIVSGPVFDYSVSRALGKVAFRLEDSSIGVDDVATHTVTMIPGGEAIPGLDIRLTEAFE
jgi:hypothetical protein